MEESFDDPRAHRRVIDARWYAKNADRKRAYTRERLRVVTAARRSAGLCIDCGEIQAYAGSVRCLECREDLRARVQRRRFERVHAGRCTECNQQNDRSAQRCSRCLAKSRSMHRRVRGADRGFVLAALGGRCACLRPDCFHGEEPCPVADDRVLTVDHVDNDGAKHKRMVLQTRDAWTRYARAIRAKTFRLQLLCPTCHHLKDTPRAVSAVRHG